MTWPTTVFTSTYCTAGFSRTFSELDWTVVGWFEGALAGASDCAPTGVAPRNTIRAIAAVVFMAGS
jgi:hypothetical protein